MTEVKAAIVTLAAAAVFLVITVLGVGNGFWRDRAIPRGLRAGLALPAGPPQTVPASPERQSRDEGPAVLSTPEASPETGRSADQAVPVPWAPPPFFDAPTVLPTPAAAPPAFSMGPFLPLPPIAVPPPEATAPAPAPVAAPADTPVPVSETVARPVQTGQVNEFDDEDDPVSSTAPQNPPSRGAAEPGPGRSGRGSGRPESERSH